MYVEEETSSRSKATLDRSNPVFRYKDYINNIIQRGRIIQTDRKRLGSTCITCVVGAQSSKELKSNVFLHTHFSCMDFEDV